MKQQKILPVIKNSFIEAAYGSRLKDVLETQDVLNNARKQMDKKDIKYYIVSVLTVLLPLACVVIFFSLTTPIKIATTLNSVTFLVIFIRNIAKNIAEEIKRRNRKIKKINSPKF